MSAALARGISDHIDSHIGYRCVNRYAINDTSADWSAAETQVRSSVGGKGKSTVVSVKSSTQAVGQKRKAEAPAASEENKKKTRRSKKPKP